MRTTIDIDDAALRRARIEAAGRGVTLGDVVNDALRVWFDAVEARPALAELPTSKQPHGVRAGVDLSPRGLKDFLAEEDLESARSPA